MLCCSSLCLFAFFVVGLYFLVNHLLSKIHISYKDRYVLITGCDTGFGRLLCEQLDAAGCHVIATCYSHDSVKELKEKLSSRALVLKMDVAIHDDILIAFDAVKKFIPPDRGLWGLVNNAGVTGPFGPLDFLTRDHYQQTFDVNFFGMVDTCAIFLPLIHKAKGRIVNMASVAGRTAGGAGGLVSAYTSSKHAVEGFSKSLCGEMSFFGIHVAIMEPGFHNTPIINLEVSKAKAKQFWEQADPERRARYGETYVQKVAESMDDTVSFGDPQNVVEAYKSALFSRFPKYLYVVGWDARLLWVPLSYMPTQFILRLYHWKGLHLDVKNG